MTDLAPDTARQTAGATGPAFQGAAGGISAGHVAVAMAVVGAALLTALTVMAMSAPFSHFGSDIYDQIWLGLLDGRLDLPARTLRLEGHYTPDGTGYSYHGLAPLITRALLDPFVTVGAAPISALSIWLWTLIGTGFWHAVVWQAGRAVWNAPKARGRALAGILSAAVWIAGPGVIVASNHALYHEPIALAYALTAGFAYFWIRAEGAGRGLTGVLILLALLAATSLHARPNMAVGLYAATGLAVLRALWQAKARAVVPGMLALGLLGAGAWGYLELNEARFGDRTEAHGSFEAGAIQYGSVFWGYEKADDIRPQAFIDHGRFNPLRILPNAVLYYVAPPQIILFDAYESLRRWHYYTTEPHLGFIRVEAPGVGIVPMWTPWALLALAGLAGVAAPRARPYLGLVAGLGAATLLTLSYGTVTLRYHVDLFPFVMVLAALGIMGLSPKLSSEHYAPGLAIVLVMVTIFGTSVNLRTAHAYHNFFQQTPGTAFEVWTLEICQQKAAERGFGAERMAEICAPPRSESDTKG